MKVCEANSIPRALRALVLVVATSPCAFAQHDDPAVNSWIGNDDGRTGSSQDPGIDAWVSTILADVQQVCYTNRDGYLRATGVPAYDVGPWPDGNPGIADDMQWVFRIPRSPVEETGNKMRVPLGPVGVWVNGVVLFNPEDAHSYKNQGVWNQNAIVAEANGFDSALGHPAPKRNGGDCGGYVCGVYHHHQNPTSLRIYLGDDGSHHSPVLGFAFDGFPIYGPFGFDNTDGSGGVVRIKSSYKDRNITVRHVLPDGTVLPPHLWGPDVSNQYPLGFYLEDHKFRAARGHLDEYNGRFCVTPDYPNGTYAYFMTTAANGDADFPYILGPEYYGEVATDNLNQSVNIPGHAECYVPSQARWTTYGDGFPGTYGEPTLTPDADPVLGSTIGMELTNSSGQSTFSVTFVGVQDSEIQGSWGGDLLVVPVFSVTLVVPPNGSTWPGHVPDDLNLNGVDIYLQSLMADPGAARNLSSTKGLQLTLGL